MGGEPVAQTSETVREQEDRSVIAYHVWLACGDGEPRTPYTSTDEADHLRISYTGEAAYGSAERIFRTRKRMERLWK